MGITTIEQLRAEKKRLLKKSGGKGALENLSRQKRLEKKRLRAEIAAIKHPNAVVAGRVAKNLGKASGKVLFRGAKIFGKHLLALGDQQREDDRREKKKKSSKRKKRRR